MKINALGVSAFCAEAVFLLLSLFFCAPGFSQSGQSTSAPPGHLPRLILECESGQGFSSCSVWMWQGNSYSAIWSNGNIGQLTVESGDAADLRVNRVDKTGLTGTYTGKWDGKSVSDGKMTFAFKTITGSGIWTGSPTLTPVLSNPNFDYSYVNWYTTQLTGFSIYSQQGKNSMYIGTLDYDFRLDPQSPMNPGESRPFTNRPVVSAPDYVKGAAYTHNEPIAAIYSDGTTFGDANVLVLMVERRKSMIAAFTAIGTTLCTLGSRQSPVADIETALDKQHAQEDAQSAPRNEGRGMAYTFVSKILNGRDSRRLPANQAIKKAFDRVNQVRSDLAADPVKDRNGQLANPAVTPLSCNLP